jgi:hypothetical protein
MFIKSKTNEKKNSYCEYLKEIEDKSVSSNVGTATVFVSHSWKSLFLGIYLIDTSFLISY